MSKMKCTSCGTAVTHVTDSRGNEKGDVIRRRRKCPACEHRFTTYEVNSDIFVEADAVAAQAAHARQEEIDRFAASLPPEMPRIPLQIRPQRRSE